MSLATRLSAVMTTIGNTVRDYSVADRSRSNHTGAQAISTITSLQAELDGKAASNAATITVSTTAPSSPVVNDLWVDTT